MLAKLYCVIDTNWSIIWDIRFIKLFWSDFFNVFWYSSMFHAVEKRKSWLIHICRLNWGECSDLTQLDTHQHGHPYEMPLTYRVQRAVLLFYLQTGVVLSHPGVFHNVSYWCFLFPIHGNQGYMLYVTETFSVWCWRPSSHVCTMFWIWDMASCCIWLLGCSKWLLGSGYTITKVKFTDLLPSWMKWAYHISKSSVFPNNSTILYVIKQFN